MTLLGRPLRWPVLAVAAALLVAAVLVYAVRSDGSGPGYRLATATTGDVEQVIAVGGTVDAARRADLAFATGGTVAGVAVAQGQKVKAGQVVATLDTTSLRATVIDAEATLAKAKAQLASDRSAQTQAVTTASSSSGTKPSSGKPSSGKPATGTPSTSGQGAGGTAVLATLRKQQAAVLSAQSAASKAIAAAKQALQAQTQACADAVTAAATDDDSGDGSGDQSAAAGADDAMDACNAALDEVRDRQDDVSSAQDTLAGALDDLASTLTKALGTVAASQGTSASTGQGTGQSAGTTETGATTGSAASNSPQQSGMGRTVTAATLASDQAAIDQAAADLVEAKQALSRATLRSTRPGRVAAVQVATGDSVSAGDTVAVVVGGKAVTVTASVSESQVGRIRAGQAVRVTTPGSDAAATGTVTAVGLVGDSSSGSATYPVTIVVESPEIPLPAGSRAMVAITVGTAEDVVTVPVSAVRRTGESAVVRVERNGAIADQRVTLGAVGATRVAVTEGVSAGDRVVLADLGQSITGASDTLDSRPGFAGGPGGGAFPGGMPPGMQRGGR